MRAFRLEPCTRRLAINGMYGVKKLEQLTADLTVLHIQLCFLGVQSTLCNFPACALDLQQ